MGQFVLALWGFLKFPVHALSHAEGQGNARQSTLNGWKRWFARLNSHSDESHTDCLPPSLIQCRASQTEADKDWIEPAGSDSSRKTPDNGCLWLGVRVHEISEALLCELLTTSLWVSVDCDNIKHKIFTGCRRSRSHRAAHRRTRPDSVSSSHMAQGFFSDRRQSRVM